MIENSAERKEIDNFLWDHQYLSDLIQTSLYEKVNARVLQNIDSVHHSFTIEGVSQNEPISLTFLCQLSKRQQIFYEEKRKLLENYQHALLLIREDENKRVSQIETREEHTRKKLILTIDSLERERKVLSIENDKMKDQIKRLKLVEQQSKKKVALLQKNTQKLEYQIEQKNRVINSMNREISEFCQEIAEKNFQSYNQLVKFSIQFEAEVQFTPKPDKYRQKIIEEQRMLAEMMGKILQAMQSKQRDKVDLLSAQNMDLDSQSDRLEIPKDQQFFKQIKDLISKIGEKTKKLIEKKQQSQRKYEKQSKKYSQFLQQTDQRLKECKQKIKQLQRSCEKSINEKERAERQMEQLKKQKQENEERYDSIRSQLSLQLNCIKEQRQLIKQKFALLIAEKQQLERQIQHIVIQKKKADCNFQSLMENTNHIEKALNESRQQSFERLRQLTRMTNQMAKVMEILHSNKQKAEKQKEGLTKLVEKLQQQLKYKQTKISEVEEKQKSEEQKFNKHISMLTVEIQSLRQSISTLKNVITIKQEQKQSQPQLVDASVIQQMMDKTYEIRLQNARLKDLVEVLKSKHMELEKQIQREKQEREKQKTYYISDIQELKKGNQEIEKAKRELGEVVEDKVQEIFHLTAEKQTLYRNNEKIVKKCAQMQQQINLYKNQANLRQIAFLEAETANFPLYENLEVSKLQIFVLNQLLLNQKREKQPCSDKCIQASFLYPQQQFEQEEEVTDFRIKEAEIKTKRNNSSGEKLKLRKRRAQNSIGCLVNTKKGKENLITQNSQNQQYLNKTFKIKNQLQQVQKNQVQDLNDIINYMVNYLKGYTRNGIRKLSWIGFQGEQHLRLIQSSKNIKQKYATFQRVRSLTQKNQVCKQLISDYEKIVNFYFQFLPTCYQDPTSFRKNVSPENHNNQNTKVKCAHLRDSSYFSK